MKGYCNSTRSSRVVTPCFMNQVFECGEEHQRGPFASFFIGVALAVTTGLVAAVLLSIFACTNWVRTKRAMNGVQAAVKGFFKPP
ncbi:unnamed protein product [Cylicocyclus nassatus]|uniref:Uncharacterized protein n=1 Tax=Cylicocyclus nassatus TaxID=53992 RepID=A0AA36GNS9_CYLNA|nr:unnamed protein product [Cylicocyclus nassatus]